MGLLSQDVRFALRVLRKNAGFTVLAMLTLALGIGATTAIFSVVNVLLLRSLPYQDPGRLVLVSTASARQPAAGGPFSYARFQQLRDHSRSFSRIAAFTFDTFTLTGRGDPEQLNGARASAGFLEVLGVRPALGRAFRPEEDQPGGKLVAILSDGLWQRRFGGARDIVGQTLTAGANVYTIIGVMPPRFEFGFLGFKPDLWTTREFEQSLLKPAQVQAGAGYLTAVARLGPGVSLAAAQAEMEVLGRQYLREFPKLADADPSSLVKLGVLQEQLVRNLRPALLVLAGAVALLLLISCANVAGLLLARGMARRKEIALRLAVGASRANLIRQFLTEAIVLALASGLAGVLAAAWGTSLLANLMQENLPRAEEIGMDWQVLAFGLAASLATGVLFGLLPALQLSRADMQGVLREEGRGMIGGPGRQRARGLMLVGQIALSMVLLVGAGLLMRSLLHTLGDNLGCDPRNVLTMSISLAPSRYPSNERIVAFFDQVLEKVSGLPGVRATALSYTLPASPFRFAPVLIEGQPEAPLPERPLLPFQAVSPGYFAALAVPLLRGRLFQDGDRAGAPPVAMVNAAFAARYWPDLNPLGKRVLVGRLEKPAEVVGVVGDVKNMSLTVDPQPEIFLPYRQQPWTTMWLSVRTEGNPRAVAGAVRRRILEVDPEQPVAFVQTLEEALAASVAQSRLTAYLLSLFCAAALFLALVGIYGSVAWVVTARTQEMGVRMAVGAQRGDILRLVLRQVLLQAAAGVTLGIAGALAINRVLGSLLYHVSATDPATYLASAAVFSAVALAAGYLPARRAMRVDPAMALRYE